MATSIIVHKVYEPGFHRSITESWTPLLFKEILLVLAFQTISRMAQPDSSSLCKRPINFAINFYHSNSYALDHTCSKV